MSLETKITKHGIYIGVTKRLIHIGCYSEGDVGEDEVAVWNRHKGFYWLDTDGDIIGGIDSSFAIENTKSQMGKELSNLMEGLKPGLYRIAKFSPIAGKKGTLQAKLERITLNDLFTPNDE